MSERATMLDAIMKENAWTGVCVNGASHRCGLPTFEHQGCEQFEPDDSHRPWHDLRLEGSK